MSHKVNTDERVVVATDYFWLPMDTCPRGVKVQLLNLGGVAVYGNYNGPVLKGPEPWLNWAPLPKRRKDSEVVEGSLEETDKVGDEGEDIEEGCNELLEGIHKYLGWVIIGVGVLWYLFPHFKFH